MRSCKRTWSLTRDLRMSIMSRSFTVPSSRVLAIAAIFETTACPNFSSTADQEGYAVTNPFLVSLTISARTNEAFSSTLA